MALRHAHQRPGPSTRVRVRELKTATSAGRTGGQDTQREDRLATEEPLELRLAWPGAEPRQVTVTMRTPGDDVDLATGFLLGEGIIAERGDVATVAYCTDETLEPEERFNVLTVRLARPPRREPATRYAGPTAGSSACGVCGTRSIDDALSCAGTGDLRARWDGYRVPATVVRDLPDRLRSRQRVFERTGGLHAAGLFDATGEPLAVREDVGRHNAVDKVVGAHLLSDTGPDAALLCVSGRIGFELVQKAVAAGVAVIAAVGAPSSLAVSLAERAGLCVVGFTSPGRCVVYAEALRVGSDASP